MIIDTNGFDIGDEVWIMDFLRLKVVPTKVKIDSFVIEDSITIRFKSNFYHCDERHILNVYKTKKECQLACDKLNNKNEK